jgi:hypothetical protein
MEFLMKAALPYLAFICLLLVQKEGVGPAQLPEFIGSSQEN